MIFFIHELNSAERLWEQAILIFSRVDSKENVFPRWMLECINVLKNHLVFFVSYRAKRLGRLWQEPNP
jgi:hypothetical protein